MTNFLWLLAGVVVGAVLLAVCMRWWSTRSRYSTANQTVSNLLKSHFDPLPVTNIIISERQFPYRVRVDLQKAFHELFETDSTIVHFCGVRKEYAHEGVKLSDCIVPSEHSPAVSVPPEYEQVDIGQEQPVPVLKNGLWLLESQQTRFAVVLAPCGRYGETTGVMFQIGTPNSPAGTAIAQQFFRKLEIAVQRAESYRGKILSLEVAEHSYTGAVTGIKVHKLRHVERHQVVLPEKTIALLERNVIRFVQNRQRLAAFKQSTKKGILFYGPPGTGKTHTIHYLAGSLERHTTLLISAEQVGNLGEYMTLARLLQPSIVVLEDVDLIARNRTSMKSACEEVLLNKLLNEMDGLKEDADILFLLTTNRPETIEAALAARPGRIDQSIEFPAPDESGRRKLVQLYGHGAQLDDQLVDRIVNRTEGVSGAFIKELMRRTIQYQIERNGDGSRQVTTSDVDAALDEMLFTGGSLNLKLLGAAAPVPASTEECCEN